jgi:hypothetical protein
MRKYFVSAFVLVAMLAFATSGFALEKSATRFNDDNLGDWNAGTSSCTVFYYNICTGYIWVWSGWAAQSVVGTVFDTCCDPLNETSLLSASDFYYRTGAVPNYGFTGTVAVTQVDGNNCPTGILAIQPILPATGWNTAFWGVPVPNKFAIVHTVADDNAYGTPATIATDGPNACGVCYPTTRTSNSYTWGTTGSPLCPGFMMNDGNCNVEFLADAYMVCEPVSVQEESWGSIKNLYR